jgi:Flp pilus assembly protein TadD
MEMAMALGQPARGPMTIRLEPAKAMTARQEAELVRAALSRNPASRALRLRLAQLLHQLDAFDETIALLSASDSEPLDFQAALILAAACFARDAAGDSTRARAATQCALVLAADDRERSAALADQAKAACRDGSPDSAVATLEQALELDPHNRIACKRLTVLWLARGDADAVIAMTDRLASKGVAHARLLAARTMALAQQGALDAARATIDLPRFLLDQSISPPAGWDSLQDFNAALAAEVTSHPGLRFERYGTASERSWRIEASDAGITPCFRAALDRILEAVDHYVAGLSGAHPWLSARPRRARMRSWCVLSESEGFEQWHMHPFGWLSGVYYVQVAPAMESDTGTAGALAFGLPDGFIGSEAAQAFGETIVRPRAGTLLLFPSHSYHRTFPHGGATRRISIAFDVMPE